MDAEEQDEEEPGKEGGQGEADEGEGGGDLVEDGVWPHRGVDTDGQGHEQAQELGGAEHKEGGGQALHDQGGDVDPAYEGEAPVTLEHGGDAAGNARRSGRPGRTAPGDSPAPPAARWD